MYYSETSEIAKNDSEFRGVYDASFLHDTRFYNENEFEIGLRDYVSVFTSGVRSTLYTENVEDLNWFQSQTLEPYMRSLDTFAAYTKYVILNKVFVERTYVIADLENFFVDQLYSYMKLKKIIEKDSIKTLAKYAINLKTEIEYFDSVLKRYKNFQGGFNFFFNSKFKVANVYKFTLPIVAYNSSDEVEVYLLNPYCGKIPNWFSIASIYKIYRYFASLNITVVKLHFNWYNLDNFFTSTQRQTIPLTENVAKMVAIYGDIFPFPYVDIFNPKNPVRYKITPLRELVKDFK